MEQLELTTPIVYPSTTAWRVSSITLDIDSRVITISLVNGVKPTTVTIVGNEAATLMVALNKANLSVKSLQRRILEYLSANRSEFSGTISGTVD